MPVSNRHAGKWEANSHEDWIDTGAAVSIISEDQQKLLLHDAIIEELPIKLKTYTGETILVIGRVNANVKCG